MSGHQVPTTADMELSSRQVAALDPYLVDIARRHPTHAFLGGATQAVYRAQVDLLRRYAEQKWGSAQSVTVLDWGAGKGHISYLLRNAGFQVTSCDIVSEDDDSSFAQMTPIIDEQNVPIVPLTDPRALPFGDHRFDMVVSFGVLEHVTDDLASLREIRRVLKPGGVLFFSFLPYHWSWSQKLAHLRGNFYHDRLYNHADLKRLAAESGLELGHVWHGQLFPKNGVPFLRMVERIDRFLTRFTPLRHFATNLEGFFIAPA